MKTVLFALLILLSACTARDGEYTLVAHEDMTDTLQVTVEVTSAEDIVINSGMMYFEFIGSNTYVHSHRYTQYKGKKTANGFILIGIDNEDLYHFTKNKP